MVVATLAAPSKSALRRERAAVAAALTAGSMKKSKPKNRPSRASRGGEENQYLATILDAEDCRGVKLPDPITFPSSVYSLELDGVTTASTTNGGEFIIAVNPGNITNSGSVTAANAVVVLTDPTTGANSGFGSVAKPLVFGNPNPAVLGSMAQVRVVSAKLKVYNTASPLNCAGRFCAFALPRNTTGLGLTSLTSVMALPYSYADHALKGGEARYIPTDNVEHEYSQTSGGNIYNGWQFTNGSISGIGANTGVLGVAGSGVGASAVIAYRVVINYEFLPSSDALDFINREPSPDRPDWLNSVNAFVTKWGDRLLRPAADLASSVASVVLPGLGSLGAAAAKATLPTLTRFAANSLGRGLDKLLAPNIGAASPSKYGLLPY